MENLTSLRKNIATRKRWDIVFACVGLLALAICLFTLAALLFDMVRTGAPRLNAEFLTNFPSRRAENAAEAGNRVHRLAIDFENDRAALDAAVVGDR